jgi:hypothetical protein
MYLFLLSNMVPGHLSRPDLALGRLHGERVLALPWSDRGRQSDQSEREQARGQQDLVTNLAISMSAEISGANSNF